MLDRLESEGIVALTDEGIVLLTGTASFEERGFFRNRRVVLGRGAVIEPHVETKVRFRSGTTDVEVAVDPDRGLTKVEQAARWLGGFGLLLAVLSALIQAGIGLGFSEGWTVLEQQENQIDGEMTR